MEPLPNEIYQDIVDFQSDVNRPIDISVYREFKKEVAWAPILIFLFLVLLFYLSMNRLLTLQLWYFPELAY